jgi:predicted aldo/keto reductase-like oxidoreductase
MIRYAIDHGVNYGDTALPDHKGVSEAVVGKALRDGYRGKVKLATKLTSFMMQKAEDMERIFSEQLARLQTDKIDFYLLHGLNSHNWPMLQEWKAFQWAEKKLAAGKIGHLGFSFHDEHKLFKQIVDGYDNWTFCQVQYNYMDINNQAGRKGVEYAAGKGMAVVVMEPIRGGLLAKEPLPDQVAKIWKTSAINRSPAEWALQWVWNQPEISVVLSGMSSMPQVKANLDAVDRSSVGKLTNDELMLIEKVREAYHSLSPIPCTKCHYCVPCPNGVEIPDILDLYNEAAMYDNFQGASMFYMGAFGGLKENQRADKCQDCGKCEEVCPQQVPTRTWLKKAHEKLFVKDFKPPF